jgi:glycosyltransferase involved in cell wall biosynthesis
MKIAFISTLSADVWGGSEELWAAAARAAIAGGHQGVASVVKWPQIPNRIAELESLGVEILRYTPLNLRAGRIRHRLGLRPFAPLARRDYDALCITQSGSHDLAFTYKISEIEKLTRGYRIPYVLICQLTIDWGFLAPEVRARATEIMQRAASVCFVSRHNLVTTQRHLARDIPNGHVVRNPVNLASTDPVPWPTGSRTIFCSAARLDSLHKGQDVLLAALAEPQWRDRDWELWLCGRGPDQAYLEQLVKYYDLGQRVIFRGQISDIRKLWESAHLLVMPSRYEGTPLALVEAMLCGRPAVVTDVGGNSEWISEGENGFIAPAAIPKYFSQALERAWRARDQWQEFGRRARETALRLYDPKPGETILKLLTDSAAAGKS